MKDLCTKTLCTKQLVWSLGVDNTHVHVLGLEILISWGAVTQKSPAIKSPYFLNPFPRLGKSTHNAVHFYSAHSLPFFRDSWGGSKGQGRQQYVYLLP